MSDQNIAAPDSFLHDIAVVINRYGRENTSNTPDFILAGVMIDALRAFENASLHRETWYGMSLEPVPPSFAPSDERRLSNEDEARDQAEFDARQEGL